MQLYQDIFLIQLAYLHGIGALEGDVWIQGCHGNSVVICAHVMKGQTGAVIEDQRSIQDGLLFERNEMKQNIVPHIHKQSCMVNTVSHTLFHFMEQYSM